MSSIFEFLSKLLDFISGIFSSKKEDKANLWSEIEDCRHKLSVALSQGSITDVHALRKRLDKLMKQYSRGVRHKESELSRSIRRTSAWYVVAVFFTSFALSILLSACSTSRGKSKVEVLVIGERINIVKPGSQVQVPDLVKPARMWYLLDDVAIKQWLGLDIDLEDR